MSGTAGDENGHRGDQYRTSWAGAGVVISHTLLTHYQRCEARRVELRARADGDEPAAPHHRDAPCDRECSLEVVAHEQDREPLRDQALHEVDHAPALAGAERGG